MKRITDELFALQDLKYKDFHSKLIPNVDSDALIGVRVPQLRTLAKKLQKEEPELVEEFLKELPHKYYDENQLHGIFIGATIRDTARVLQLLDEFLPYVDNWAVCDSMHPKCFAKDPELVRPVIEKWLSGPEVYRIRFAIVTFIDFFLDGEFRPADLERMASIKTDEYYINMAIAWYYSFALIKQYDATIPLFEAKTLDKWIHNKSLQKAVESFRIDDETKIYLKSLKIK